MVSERTRIQLCGRLSVERDGEQLAGALRGKQVPLLFAYLVLNRLRQIGREELIGALWPSHAPLSQDGSLRTLLSRLRSVLGREALVGRDELNLELPQPLWIDYEAAVHELERAQTALSAGDARAAWALAQIPLNISGRGLLPGAQADWLEPHRRELASVRLDALEVIGRAGLALGPGQTASVERAGRALIEAERFRESGYTLLMGALAARGETAEALRVFDELRTLLREELAMVPSTEAIAAHDRLVRPGGLPPSAGQPAERERVPLPAELSLRSRGRLIGRGDELDQLWARWQAARDRLHVTDPDTARVVLLNGEPGIGKTRLLAALAERAYGEGAVVLHGRAPEETLVPYQPFLDALRHYVVSLPAAELSSTVREYGPELSRLMPELRRRLPDLPVSEPGEFGGERYRLFEAVVGLLGEIAEAAPLLLVLDDLHWADRASLGLLRHLMRGARRERLLVIAAYRRPEARTGDLGIELAELRRDRIVAELAIEGLSEPATAELARELMGAPPPRAFVQALHGETEGNPFFIEEIVRTLLEAGVAPAEASPGELQRAGVPDGVRQVITRRLDRLDPGALDLLRTASVIGRDFDVALLEQVVAADEESLLAGLDEVLAAGLVVEAKPSCYSFSHALIRESLYDAMSSARRARIHRRVAEALERSPGSKLSALALHFTRAAEPQDAEKAIGYARSAAAEAAGVLAHEEAAAHLERALEVSERALPEDIERRCELLLDLAEEHVRAGDRRLARPAFKEAAALAERLGDTAALARAAIGASRRYVQPPGVVDNEIIAMLERALDHIGEQPTPMRPRLLARLCGAIYYSPARGRMAELAEAARRVAEALGDPESLAHACAARRRALWEPARLTERLASATEMLELASEIPNLELELQAHAWLVVDLLEAGDLTAVDAQIEAFAVGADRLRQPLYVWNALVWRGMRSLLSGRLDEAEAWAAETLAAAGSGEAVTATQYHAVQLMAIRREQGRLVELEQATRGLVEAYPERVAWRAALTTLLARDGRLAEAGEQFERAARHGFSDITRDGDWLITLCLLAEACAELGDRDAARHLLELLAPYADSNVVVGLAAACLGSVSGFLGRLAAVAGDPERARRYLERALRANTALRAPLCVAHTQLDLAALLAGTPEAARLTDSAARIAQEHPAGALSARLQRGPG